MRNLRIYVYASFIVLTSFLTIAIAQTSSPSKAPTKNSESRDTNSPNLVSAAGDSEKRFQLWLASRAKTKEELSSEKSASFVPDATSDVNSLLKKSGWADWEAHIIWSWGDMGPMESEVQREVVRLDQETHKNMYSACIWPGGLIGRVGRACIMQIYACDAARNKFDDWAWKMTIATQMHNGGAVSSLQGAGAFKVAEFIRNNRGCR